MLFIPVVDFHLENSESIEVVLVISFHFCIKWFIIQFLPFPPPEAQLTKRYQMQSEISDFLRKSSLTGCHRQLNTTAYAHFRAGKSHFNVGQ